MTFVSLYVELPVMLVMFLGWKAWKRTKFVGAREMDLVTDTFVTDEDQVAEKGGWKGKGYNVWRWVL